MSHFVFAEPRLDPPQKGAVPLFRDGRAKKPCKSGHTPFFPYPWEMGYGPFFGMSATYTNSSLTLPVLSPKPVIVSP